jgi:N-methylhydantoinase B/oxoprolinase/acetone carboxylase alpha subunit
VGFINSTFATTRSAVAAAIYQLAPLVANSGMMRSVVVEAPSGSIVNCDYPFATAWSPYHPAVVIKTMIRDSLKEWIPPTRAERPAQVRLPVVRIDGCREESCPF